MKGYLLDTRTFLWWVDGSSNLSTKAGAIISNPQNPCYFSLASSWELSIKASIGKLKLSIPVREYVTTHIAANRFKQLGLTLNHVTRVETLDWHHRDPFDRLLIAQALENNLHIISSDKAFDLYGIERFW
jgi:PIN domain nuclease of toxin-antitoxin system